MDKILNENIIKKEDQTSPQSIFLSKIRYKSPLPELTQYYNDNHSNINLTLKDIDKNFPLHIAISSKNYHAANFIISHFENKSTDINLQNSLGWSALHTSCALPNTEEITALLIHNGSNVNLLNKNKQTPLHLSCGKNRAENVKVLLSSTQIQINLKDNYGFTPLIKASASQAYDVIPILIKEIGIKLNESDKSGNTALHYLLEDNQYKLGIELIKIGGDPYKENKDGKTPIDLIQDEDIKYLILKAYDKASL